MSDVKELLTKADGLLSGHLCLTSGLHSDTYFQCAKLYQYPDIVEKLALELAEKLKDVEFDTIVAPAIGAVIFGYEVARATKSRNLFVERKDGTMQLRRGYEIKEGEKQDMGKSLFKYQILFKEEVTIEQLEKEGIEVVNLRKMGSITYLITSLDVKDLIIGKFNPSLIENVVIEKDEALRLEMMMKEGDK